MQAEDLERDFVHDGTSLPMAKVRCYDWI
jgi:hypothetical protein